MPEHDNLAKSLALAWAAGFFCGEGSFISHWSKIDELWYPAVNIAQTSTTGMPHVLKRTLKTVRLGKLRGPYATKVYAFRVQPHWQTLRLAALLWPWLREVKRQQAITAFGHRLDLLGGKTLTAFLAAHRRANPPKLINYRTRAHELAWAAGLFDGEGWIGYTTNRRKSGTSYTLGMNVRQSSVSGVPQVLKEFQRIVGHGVIDGPWLNKKHKNRSPSYSWRPRKRAEMRAVFEKLYPYLTSVKRQQGTSAIKKVLSVPHLKPELARICGRGHTLPWPRIILSTGGIESCRPCKIVRKQEIKRTGTLRYGTYTRTAGKWRTLESLRTPLETLTRKLKRVPTPKDLAKGTLLRTRVTAFGGMTYVAKKLKLSYKQVKNR